MKYRELIIGAMLLVAFGVIMRLVPHEPNMTPLTAIALGCSMYFGRRWALVLPVVALALSDIFIGSYDWRIMASVYGSFLLIGAISWLAGRVRNIYSVGATLIASSLTFFFVTNTAVWFFSPWYEKSLAGFLYCLELGIPFLRNMFLGDLIYTPLVLAALYLAYAPKPLLAARARAILFGDAVKYDVG